MEIKFYPKNLVLYIGLVCFNFIVVILVMEFFWGEIDVLMLYMLVTIISIIESMGRPIVELKKISISSSIDLEEVSYQNWLEKESS